MTTRQLPMINGYQIRNLRQNGMEDVAEALLAYQKIISDLEAEIAKLRQQAQH